MDSRRVFLKKSALVAAATGVLGPAALGRKKKQEIKTPQLMEMNGPRSLRSHAAASSFLVGCAVDPGKLDAEPAYAAAIAEQANIVVPENAMKWAALRPAMDRYDFRAADDLVAFALTHDQFIRGHNLCWHEALPDWFAAQVNQANAQQVLVDHIRTVAGRYAGKMHSWDVVNEAVEPKDGRPDGMRKSPWLELLGPGYVEIAYRAARQADPKALLTYNDYAIELDTPEQIEKRGQVLMLLRRMKARQVPIDAVGVQSHLTADKNVPGQGLIDFVQECRLMGLQVFVTELDINDRNLPEDVAERDKAVAQLYSDYLKMMLAEPNVTAALTWGITDKYTWLDGAKWGRADGRPERPLPFDSDYQPKPAFFAERGAIDTRAAIYREQARPASDPYAPFRPGTPSSHMQQQ